MRDPRFGDPLESAVERDAELVAALHWLQAHDPVPPPDPQFVRQVREELMHAPTLPMTRLPTSWEKHRNDPAVSRAWPHVAVLSVVPPWRSWLASLATAALIVLALVGSIVTIGSHQLRPVGPTVVALPAAATAPASLAPGVTEDAVLLRATLEQMPPSGGTQQIALYRNRLAPGAVEPVGSQADTGVSNELCTIESGQVTVEAAAPVFLTRAIANPAAAPSLVEPGTTIVLDVGDQLLAPSGVSFRRWNDGSTPATVLCFSIGAYGDSARIWSNLPGVTYDHGLPFKFLSTFPAVPVEATVHRLTLAPDAELAIRDLPELELVYVEAGTLDLVYDKAETPATPERVFTIHAGSGTETFGRTPERAVLANRGTAPLVLLLATVGPANAGAATPQAP